MRRTTVLLAALLAGSVGLDTPAQLPTRYQVFGDAVDDRFGLAVAAVGDVDGDGIGDFVVGAQGADVTGPATGTASLHSGADGVLLDAFHGWSAHANYGRSAAGLGDVDGDGVPDFAIGARAPGRGLAEIRSGADGSIIHSLFAGPSDSLGASIARSGDLNGDGVADMIVGGFGVTVVFSGADGAILYTFDGWEPDDYFGDSVAGGVDIDADGVDDIIIGAPRYDGINGPDAGRVRVYSGATGLPMFTLGGFWMNEFGYVSGLEDINGDGRDEFIVGAPGEGWNTGWVRVYSGLGAAMIYQFSGTPFPSAGRFGAWVADAGDVNGDGVHDIACGAPHDPTGGVVAGLVRIFSGADGTILLSHVGQPGERLGWAGSTGDIDGDGFSDVLAGAPWDSTDSTLRTGSVVLLSAAGTRRYGDTLAPSQTLDLGWSPGTGPDPALGAVSITGAAAGAAGVLGLSYESGDATYFGVPFVIDVNPALLLATVPLAFDSTGSVSLAASIRHPGLAGFAAWSQAFTTSPQLTASNGLEFRLVE